MAEGGGLILCPAEITEGTEIYIAMAFTALGASFFRSRLFLSSSQAPPKLLLSISGEQLRSWLEIMKLLSRVSYGEL